MTVSLLEFQTGSRLTLGVEIEFQILERRGYSLVPQGPNLLVQAPDILRPRISPEFIKSIFEIQTGICEDVRDVENDLMETCALAQELAADNDCLLYAASLHPFARVGQQEASDDSRYMRIMQELQLVGRRLITQGLHVHVGLPDGDTAIRVGNCVQAFLPIFLALTTSSPYFQGVDTGFMSYRTKLFESLPLAGLYDLFDDWRHFAGEVAMLQDYGIIDSFTDLWWDARPNPNFGTLEIRICDLPCTFTDILAVVALIQSVVAWLAEGGQQVASLNRNLLQANKWQAARHGLEGRYIDPSGLLGGKPMSLRLAAMLLKKKVLPHAADHKAGGYLQAIDAIISGGTGADHQRRIFSGSNSFKEMIEELQRSFWK